MHVKWLEEEEREKNANFHELWVFINLTSICAEMNKIIPTVEKPTVQWERH